MYASCDTYIKRKGKPDLWHHLSFYLYSLGDDCFYKPKIDDNSEVRRAELSVMQGTMVA